VFITNEPPDIAVVENQSTALTVGVVGDDPHYQWYKDSLLIPGATSSSLTFSNPAISDSGFYYVLVTNIDSFVTSRVAHLTVSGDVNGPTLLFADGTASTTNVLAAFSEPLLASTATNILNYK